MEEKIAMCLKKLEILEKKLETYYKLLLIRNELEFVIKGSYITEEDIQKINNGEY